MKLLEVSEQMQMDIDYLSAMPKVELHVHLEGATTPETIREMAQRNGVRLPVPDADLENFFQYRNFDHFVEAYYAATSTMLTLEDWRLMIDRFMAHQASQNVIYSEVFISASHHLGRMPVKEWIATLGEAMKQGESAHGVRIQLIPDISREVPETSRDVLDFVLEAHDAGVALGLGLGGPELGFPPELFAEYFLEARSAGLHVVAHAGETDGPGSVRGAWQTLGAERIGHGFRVLEDPVLTAEMAQANIPFEVNPTSNYCIGAVSREVPHPIRKMKDAGLRVTVNSDDPALFGASLTDEYALLLRQGFSSEELWELNKNALESTFLNPSDKETLRQQYRVFQEEVVGGEGFEPPTRSV